MEITSYLLGKKSSGGGGSTLIETKNPLTETPFYYNVTKIHDMYFTGTSCEKMFNDYVFLEEVDVSNFDVSNSTRFIDMFRGCISLTELDLSSFGETEARFYAGMFYNCSNLKKINLSNLEYIGSSNLSSTGAFSEAFFGCTKLEELDMRSFNFLRVKSGALDGIFYGVPTDCLIIVKDTECKEYLKNVWTTNNIKAVSEL